MEERDNVMGVFIGKACETVLIAVVLNLASILSRNGTWDLEETVLFVRSPPIWVSFFFVWFTKLTHSLSIISVIFLNP